MCESPNNIFDHVPFILTGYDYRESREDQKVVCSFSKGCHSLIPIIEAEEKPYQSPPWHIISSYVNVGALLDVWSIMATNSVHNINRAAHSVFLPTIEAMLQPRLWPDEVQFGLAASTTS